MKISKETERAKGHTGMTCTCMYIICVKRRHKSIKTFAINTIQITLAHSLTLSFLLHINKTNKVYNITCNKNKTDNNFTCVWNG